MEALGLNLGYLLVQIFNFLILFLVLRAWVLKPLMNMLEKRREVVAKGLEDARVAADARANAEKDAERIKAEAQIKSAELLRLANEKAEALGKDLRNQVLADAEKVRQSALEKVESEKMSVLTELRGQVASLAIAAAQKLVGEALDEKRQHALLDEFFSGVKSGKVVVLPEGELAGTRIDVTSALPLTEAECDLIRADLLSKAKSPVPVAFAVDPSILGGLIIRAGDRIIDGSVAGQLEGLRQTLK